MGYGAIVGCKSEDSRSLSVFCWGKAHRGGYSDGLGIAISFQLCFTKGGPRLDPKGKVVYNVTT